MLDSRQDWLAHPHPIPRPLRNWLSDHGSLTARLKARCAAFRVLPLRIGIARPNPDEVELLGLRPGMRAYVRDVLLLCNEVPVVFAHSVLPQSGLRGGTMKPGCEIGMIDERSRNVAVCCSGLQVGQIIGADVGSRSFG